MARRIRLVSVFGLTLLLAATLALPPLGVAQATRIVTASARCLDAGPGGEPQVEVTLTNQSGRPLTVSYVHGYTSPQVFIPMMRAVAPDDMPPVVIPDGKTRVLTAPWDDLGDPPGVLGGALVVTSAGALVPACTDRPVDADELLLGPAPASAAEARIEDVTLTVRMLGLLEQWRAYPALYQLLHPDARAEVPFAVMTCWYAARYGLSTDPLMRVVFSNTVDEVGFGSWTWAVTGKTYPDAAAVAYRQTVGTIADSEEIATSMHLVESEGQWRWFFGTSQEALAALSPDCDLASAG
jgi:hypothetical protein